MNKLTLDFFNNPHPGLDQSFTIADDVFSTNVPIVELKVNLDVARILNEALVISKFEELVRPAYEYESTARVANWFKTPVYQEPDIEKSRYYTNLIERKLGDEPLLPVNTDKNRYTEFFSQINGFEVEWCHIMELRPDGYLTPHRDINVNTQPLRYFWIPLNYPEGSKLGIYPMGEISINLGSIYLLNQRNYVHSVANFGKENRYILNGMFKLPTSVSFESYVRSCISLQYNII